MKHPLLILNVIDAVGSLSCRVLWTSCKSHDSAQVSSAELTLLSTACKTDFRAAFNSEAAPRARQLRNRASRAERRSHNSSRMRSDAATATQSDDEVAFRPRTIASVTDGFWCMACGIYINREYERERERESTVHLLVIDVVRTRACVRDLLLK